MSSEYVRNTIKTFLDTEFPGVVTVDMTAASDNLDDFLEDISISPEDQWIGLQFLPADERPVSLSANNSTSFFGKINLMLFGIVKESRDSAIISEHFTLFNTGTCPLTKLKTFPI